MSSYVYQSAARKKGIPVQPLLLIDVSYVVRGIRRGRGREGEGEGGRGRGRERDELPVHDTESSYVYQLVAHKKGTPAQPPLLNGVSYAVLTHASVCTPCLTKLN